MRRDTAPKVGGIWSSESSDNDFIIEQSYWPSWAGGMHIPPFSLPGNCFKESETPCLAFRHIFCEMKKEKNVCSFLYTAHNYNCACKASLAKVSAAWMLPNKCILVFWTPASLLLCIFTFCFRHMTYVGKSNSWQAAEQHLGRHSRSQQSPKGSASFQKNKGRSERSKFLSEFLVWGSGKVLQASMWNVQDVNLLLHRNS